MTAVFGLIDPDRDRREKVLRNVTSAVSGETDVTVNRSQVGPVTIVSAIGATAPLDQRHTSAFSAWVLGHVYHTDGVGAAEGLCRRMEDGGLIAANGVNGYYLACCADKSGRVALGTDVLGFFPLHFWATTDCLVFATEPSLIRLHPLFVPSLNLEGLAGILLLGHEANGQGMWKGLVRVTPGHAIEWAAGRGASMRSANSLSVGDAYFGISQAEARERYAATLETAVRRVVQPHAGKIGIMLSGGMDSRLVVAHLSRIAAGRLTAFTFGDPGDIEFRCAAGVAGSLGLPLTRVPFQFDAFAAVAADCVAKEQMGNTLWDPGWMTGIDEIRQAASPLCNGFFGDRVAGNQLEEVVAAVNRGFFSFEKLFAKCNAHGMSPADIAELIAVAPMEQVVADVVSTLRARFDALPGNPAQKVWLWELLHSNRHHVAPYAWRMSGAAWPLMPYLDREHLELMGNMPTDCFDRKLQVATLKTEFPSLARLPLDRNSRNDSPLIPTRRPRRKRKLGHDRISFARSGVERRTYVRVFDFNNAGWRAVRELAERSRVEAGRWMRPAALARWLPPPQVTVTLDTPIRDSACRKTLTLLMVLAGQEGGRCPDPADASRVSTC